MSFEIRIEYINVLCTYSAEYLNIEPGGAQSNHWALNG